MGAVRYRIAVAVAPWIGCVFMICNVHGVLCLSPQPDASLSVASHLQTDTSDNNNSS
jgi:hypothetical protein